MRIMGLALTGAAVALAGMLFVGGADPAFAKPPKGCSGKHQAMQNGQCVTTADENPDRSLPTSWYRSHSQKNQKKHKTAKTS
jgi:hypothetical protein